MTNPRFLQIHTLHSYPAALLNRDDSGIAKRIPFGGVTRTRISSQCLKRHWRFATGEFAIHGIEGAESAIRSRNIVGRQIINPIREINRIDKAVVAAVEDAFTKGVYGSNAKPGENSTATATRQSVLLGMPEVNYLRQRAAEVCEQHPDDALAAGKAASQLFSSQRSAGANFRAMLHSARLPAGLEGALFGRMVTSDPAANIDAAIHVAHAFTVHRQESKNDYFSTVDDLKRDDEDAGAAHLGETELTSGLYYGYVVIELPTLVSNLEGIDPDDWETADRKMASDVVRNLVHLIAEVSPGAKLGSTAPYAFADLMLIEAGNRQPRSLASAYRVPCQATVEAAAAALSQRLTRMDEAYGIRETRRLMSVDGHDLPEAFRMSMDELAQWAAHTSLNNGQE